MRERKKRAAERERWRKVARHVSRTGRQRRARWGVPNGESLADWRCLSRGAQGRRAVARTLGAGKG